MATTLNDHIWAQDSCTHTLIFFSDLVFLDCSFTFCRTHMQNTFNYWTHGTCSMGLTTGLRSGSFSTISASSSSHSSATCTAMLGHLRIEGGGWGRGGEERRRGGGGEEGRRGEEEGRGGGGGRELVSTFTSSRPRLLTYLLWTQACLDLPEPPNLIMSRQKVHLPQSGI